MPTFLLSKWFWVGAAFVALGLWGAIQTGRLSVAEGKLSAALQENAALRDRIKLQNAAVDRLKAESDRKLADAATALQDARSATQPQVRESARLKQLAQRPAQPEKPRQAYCPASGADRAVAALREGL